jgi:hypothetical protein
MNTKGKRKEAEEIRAKEERITLDSILPTPSEKNRTGFRGKEPCGIDRRRTRPAADLRNNDEAILLKRGSAALFFFLYSRIV